MKIDHHPDTTLLYYLNDNDIFVSVYDYDYTIQYLNKIHVLPKEQFNTTRGGL